MDAKVQWKVSEDVEGLVAAVVECRDQLKKICAQRNGCSTMLEPRDCNAFAGSKILELLQLSEMWSPCVEFTEEDMTIPLSRRQVKTTEFVADFSLFKLHRMDVLCEDVIRVVVVFLIDGGPQTQTYYGNVELIT